MSMQTIGFIGLGNMGRSMAGNIRKAGYPLVVHDIREEAMAALVERGAAAAGSPAEVARRSDVIFTSLPGPREVEAVALGPDGILAGIRPGGLYVDLSTNRPGLIRHIETAFKQKGAAVLDAPVSGGATGAATRNLAVMVGGDEALFRKVKPILDTFGDKVFYAGAIGAGMVCKIVHNMVSLGIRQAIAEGMTLGVKAGVDPVVLWENVRRGAAGRMHFLHDSLPRMVFTGSFQPALFSLALSRKDIGLAMELGREFSVPLPVGGLMEQMAIEGVNRGWSDHDHTVLFLLQEERSGVQVRATGVDPDKAARFISTHPET